MSSSTPRTREQLRLAAGHIGYEVERCVDCAVLVYSGGFSPVVRDALEAHLIHARNVLVFLAPKDPREDDLVASDLASGNRPWAAPELPDDLKRVVGAMGKHLAHLTWVRVTSPEPKWWPLKLAHEVLTLTWLWSEHLDADLAAEIGPALARSEAHLGGLGLVVAFAATTGSGPPA